MAAHLFVVLLVLWAVALIGVVGLMFGRHLDFFDESYWLELMTHPDAARNAGEIFLFQFLLHPVLELSGENIVVFRWVGLAMLFGAVVLLVSSTSRVVTRSGPAWSREKQVVVLVCALAAVTTAYAMAGRSLGYRTVVIIGLCLTIGGMAQAWSGRPLLGSLIGGFGLVVTATGKPTTAAASAGMVLLVLVATRRREPRVWWGGVLGSMFGLSVVLLAGRFTPTELVVFLRNGYGQISAGLAYDSSQHMLGISPSPAMALLLFGPVVALPLVGAAIDVVRGRTRGVRASATDAVLGVGVAAVCSVAAVAALSSRGFGDQILPLTQVVFVVAVTTAVAYAALGGPLPMLSDTTGGADGRLPEWEPWLLLGMLVVAPYLLSLGTNTRAAYNMGQSSVFWVLAAFLGISLLQRRRPAAAGLFVPAALVSLAVTTVVQAVSLTNGGPGDSVTSATHSVPVLEGALKVNDEDAKVLADLSAVREANDLEGVPSIDLTGFSTGYQLQLGTTPLGRASFFGIFQGAERSARYALDREPCDEKARAWLLHADDNTDDVSVALTEGTNLDLDRDYEVVTTFHPTQGPSRYRSLTVRVLRPGPDVLAKLCGVSRR